MTVTKALKYDGRIHKATVWFDAQLSKEGAFVDDKYDIFTYLRIEPPIVNGDILEDAFPDFPDFKHHVSTRTCAMFIQFIERSETLGTYVEVGDYLAERIQWLVDMLDKYDIGDDITEPKR